MSVVSYALTTRDRVRDFMGKSSLTSVEQTIIDVLVNAVTDFIENYCGRRFKQTSYSKEEYTVNDGDRVIVLKNYPVSSTAAFTLEVRTSALNEDDWEEVDSEYYHIDYDAGIIKAAGGYKFVGGRRKYRVTYTAGYDYDNSDTFLSDVGAGDLELACWKLCVQEFNKRKGGAGIKSERIGDYSVTYRDGELDPLVQSILDKYARLEVVETKNPSLT